MKARACRLAGFFLQTLTTALRPTFHKIPGKDNTCTLPDNTHALVLYGFSLQILSVHTHFTAIISQGQICNCGL